MHLKRYYKNLLDLFTIFLILYILIPSYLFQLAIGPIYLSIDRFLFLILLTYWLFGLFFLPKVFVRMVKVILSQKILFLFYFLFLLISIISSYLSGISASILNSIYSTLYILVFTLLPLSIPFTPLLFKRISQIFLIVSSVLIFISIFEIIFGTNPLAPFVNVNLMTESQRGAFLDNYAGDTFRIKGTFSNPLVYGHFIVLVTPVLFFFRQYSRKKTLYFIIIILLVISGLLTRSRATFILIVLTFLIGSFYYFKSINLSKKMLIVFLLSFIVIALFSFTPELSFIFGGRELTSDQNRETQLLTSVPFILNEFYFGYGQGQSAIVLDYGTLNGGSPTIDNYFLSCILDYGIIGLIFSILFFLKVLFYFRVPRNYLPLYFGLVFFIINFLTLSLTEAHPIFYFVLSILIVLLYHEKKRSRSFS